MDILDTGIITSPTEEDEYDFNRRIEDVAKNEKCSIIRPKANELFLDLDSEESYQDFQIKLWDFLKDREGCQHTVEEWFSRSGKPKRHIIIRFDSKTFTPSERVLYQLLLGSDPKREFLDGRRLFHGVTAENTTCFFEPLP